MIGPVNHPHYKDDSSERFSTTATTQEEEKKMLHHGFKDGGGPFFLSFFKTKRACAFREFASEREGFLKTYISFDYCCCFLAPREMAWPSKRAHSLWQTINNISLADGWLNRKIQTGMEGGEEGTHAVRIFFERQQKDVNFPSPATTRRENIAEMIVDASADGKMEMGAALSPKSNILSCCQSVLSVEQICCSHIFSSYFLPSHHYAAPRGNQTRIGPMSGCWKERTSTTTTTTTAPSGTAYFSAGERKK